MAGRIIHDIFPLVLPAQDGHGQIVTAKTGHEYSGILEAKQPQHIIHNLRCRRRCKGGQDWTIGQG
ncbi:hypothetical protein D3C81_1918030 [compost metagenome]